MICGCARVQKPEPVFVTAGVEQPTDLTAHMTAGIVASTLALHRYGRLSRVEARKNIAGVRGLYNVTSETGGVLKHYRSLWRSDSFYDDKLWAVRCPNNQPGWLSTTACRSRLCGGEVYACQTCIVRVQRALGLRASAGEWRALTCAALAVLLPFQFCRVGVAATGGSGAGMPAGYLVAASRERPS